MRGYNIGLCTFIVVTNNFYSSQELFCDLIERGFGANGTVYNDSRGIPQLYIRHADNMGTYTVTSSSDDGIFSLKWKDKCEVVMLSTYHDSTMVTKSRQARRLAGGIEEIEKPQVDEDYNQNMGRVNKSEFLLRIS